MLKHMFIFLSLILPLTVSSAHAENFEGDYLYKVTTVRAEPGKFSDLLTWISDMKSSGYFEAADSEAPLIMRHSQGDQWDLLKITPMESWTVYHSKAATKTRAKAAKAYADKLKNGYGLVAFEEDVFAYGPSWKDVKAAYNDNNFYHIEMFKALAGKKTALVEQRQMENAYLGATAQQENMIFVRAAGSDIDVFTIGFHPSFESFVTQGEGTDAEREQAAKQAGFKDRADLSFYLRSLISGHHDTLAGKVD